MLNQHDAVDDAAAFSVEHRTLGEDLAAAIVLKPGMACTESDLKALAADHLVAFKVPQRIHFLDALPLTGIGKLDRLELARIGAGEPLSSGQQGEIRKHLELDARESRNAIGFTRSELTGEA